MLRCESRRSPRDQHCPIEEPRHPPRLVGERGARSPDPRPRHPAPHGAPAVFSPEFATHPVVPQRRRPLPRWERAFDLRSCGAEGTRTPYLRLAKAALYQVSYGPLFSCGLLRAKAGAPTGAEKLGQRAGGWSEAWTQTPGLAAAACCRFTSAMPAAATPARTMSFFTRTSWLWGDRSRAQGDGRTTR